MKLHRLIPSLAAVLLMAGCAGMFGVGNQQAAHSVQPVADPFQRALFEGYLRFGDQEVSELDPAAATVIFDKAIAAGRGQEVPVADPDWWNAYRGHPWSAGRWRTMITGAVRVRAYDYRDRLVPWINAMKARDPVTTAGQQVAFECWLEEMSEDDYADVDACGLNPALWVVAQQTTTVTPTPAPAPAARTYLVFFDFDRSDITPEAASIIRQAADDAKRTNVRLIVATGHADRSGPTDYNQRLSERRAASVKAALVREGIAANTIQTSGRGENDNLVATPDGVREPRNRRVEIAFR